MFRSHVGLVCLAFPRRGICVCLATTYAGKSSLRSSNRFCLASVFFPASQRATSKYQKTSRHAHSVKSSQAAPDKAPARGSAGAAAGLICANRDENEHRRAARTRAPARPRDKTVINLQVALFLARPRRIAPQAQSVGCSACSSAGSFSVSLHARSIPRAGWFVRTSFVRENNVNGNAKSLGRNFASV